ncbi:MAG: Na+/H+ antiporter [Pseudonocardiales bacterium]|nr:Na+/H+ antiporter [Actinomycetota bacterium]PZS14441.1 MAG: Na+/H+ antiporter [Pseudonocardiales bacterium]
MDGMPLILLVLSALAVTAVSRRLRLPAPLTLVVAGLAISAIPGVPDYQLDPDLILYAILPPLLYSAALDSSAIQIRANIRPIALLAVGLVLFSTACVGLVAWWLVPGLPLGAALALAAVVAPPDAVAAVSIGRRLGLPRRVMTVLTGESLFNDATALTALRVAVAAAAGTGFSLWSGLGDFLLIAAGGVVLGAVLGRVMHQVRLRLHDARLESALGLVIPFAAYALAEEVHVSGVLAVVMTALYLGHHAPQAGYATRLLDQAMWQAADTVLEAFVFALIGLQLPAVVQGVSGGIRPLLIAATAVIVTVVLARVVWMFPATYLPRVLFSRVSARDPAPRWQVPAVLSWAGMRGVVTLAAASAIPRVTNSGAPFPGRSEIIFLAFCVTVATLLLHGLTLPWVIRRLGVEGHESFHDALAEADAMHAVTQAALERLDSASDGAPESVTSRLRKAAEHRSNSVWERLGRPETELGEAPSVIYRRLRLAMLAAERETLVSLRDTGRINDDILTRTFHDLDLEEAMLNR